MLKPSGQRLRRVTLLDGCVCKQVGAPKPQRAWTELRDLAVAETPLHRGFNAHFRRWEAKPVETRPSALRRPPCPPVRPSIRKIDHYDRRRTGADHSAREIPISGVASERVHVESQIGAHFA